MDDFNPVSSSGNIYQDFGFDNADEMLMKATIVAEIQKQMEKRKLTQSKAASLLGIPQPKLSMILRGHFEGYTIDRLLRYARAFGKVATLKFKSAPKAKKAQA